jgi:hypothetical protein
MSLLSRGYDVAFLPIESDQRIGCSTVSVSTGLDTIILILRLAVLFNPLRLFLPASLVAAGVGVLWGIPYFLAARGISIGALLALVTAALLFALGLLSDQISQMRLERYE